MSVAYMLVAVIAGLIGGTIWLVFGGGILGAMLAYMMSGSLAMLGLATRMMFWPPE